MPIYCYKCNDCFEEFEIRHSMSFEEQVCISCKSSDVFKVPSIGNSIASEQGNRRPGKVVDEYIRDAREEIKQEKIKLKSEVM